MVHRRSVLVSSLLAVAWTAAPLPPAASALSAQEPLTFNRAFLMDEVREEGLARSAAPGPIADAADLYLLGSEGYERVSTGTNGFACLVLRSFSRTGDVAAGRPQPDAVAPICYNPGAVARLLPAELLRARLHASGFAADEVEAAVATALAKGAATTGEFAMAYMQSAGLLSSPGMQMWTPSVLVSAPFANEHSVGAGSDRSSGPTVIAQPGSVRAQVRIPLDETFEPRIHETIDEQGLRPLTEASRSALLRQARDNEARLMQVVGSLSPEEWTTRAEADGWSVAETLEHIAAAEAVMVTMVRSAIEKARAEGGDGGFRSPHPDSRARLKLLDRGVRFTTIAQMVPNGRFGDADGAIAAYRASRAALETLIGELDPVARTVGVPHPIFDDLLDGYQYLLQATGHADRHLEQIEEILATLRKNPRQGAF